MKFFLTLMFIFSFSVIQAQEIEPTYEVDGDRVKATYYFADGSVHKPVSYTHLTLPTIYSV